MSPVPQAATPGQEAMTLRPGPALQVHCSLGYRGQGQWKAAPTGGEWPVAPHPRHVQHPSAGAALGLHVLSPWSLCLRLVTLLWDRPLHGSCSFSLAGRGTGPRAAVHGAGASGMRPRASEATPGVGAAPDAWSFTASDPLCPEWGVPGLGHHAALGSQNLKGASYRTGTAPTGGEHAISSQWYNNVGQDFT